MANYGNCEISFLRGTWKTRSFHFLSGSDGQCQQNAIWYFLPFSLQLPRLGCGIFLGCGVGCFVGFAFFFNCYVL